MKAPQIIGISASLDPDSSNSRIISFISQFLGDRADFIPFRNLDKLPHFQPNVTDENTPAEVQEFLDLVKNCDGVIISTPEYIFSVPSILKNVLEWSLGSAVFMNKSVALITASSSGKVAHESLKLIIKTMMGSLDEKHCLLISGAKGKIKEDVDSSDKKSMAEIRELADSFLEHILNLTK